MVHKSVFHSRGVLATIANLFRALVFAFAERDAASSGFLRFEDIVAIFDELGCKLSLNEFGLIGSYYGRKDIALAKSSLLSSNLDHIKTFNNRTLAHYIDAPERHLHEFYGLVIDYQALVTKLASIIEKIIQMRGGVMIGSKYPWVLREFEFVDTLICQLEAMQPGQRRRVLMSLQYALSQADPHEVPIFRDVLRIKILTLTRYLI